MARQPRVPGAETPAPTPPESTEPTGGDLSDAVESLEQQVARLQAENQALKEAATHKLPKPEPEAPETSDEAAYRERARGLRAKDVDPTRLKRAVLTQDGWVCPATVPAPKGRE